MARLPWQIEIRGERFGEGTPFVFDEDGPELFGWSNLRTSDTNRPGLPGAVASGPDLLGVGSRPMTLPFTILAGSGEEVVQRYTEFTAAFRPVARGEADVEMILRTPGWERTIIGRPRTASIPPARWMEQGVAPVVARFDRTDPYLYDGWSFLVLPMGAAAGGLSFPHSFPHGFGSISAGLTSITNGGSAATPQARLIVTGNGGTCTDPRFTVVETGEILAFDGLSIAPGQVLVVDFATHRAVLGSAIDDPDAANVGAYIDRSVSTWWTGDSRLPRGDSTVSFAGSGTGLAALVYRPAWLI